MTGEENRCLTAERNECRNQKRDNKLVEIAAEKGERRGGKRYGQGWSKREEVEKGKVKKGRGERKNGKGRKMREERM